AGMALALTKHPNARGSAVGPRLRSTIAIALMFAAVIAVYWPLASANVVQDRPTDLLGFDYLSLHVRRIRYAREALLGPTHQLPGWYTRELGGTPFWSNIQNFPFIPTRLVLLFNPERAYFAAVQMAALLASLFTFL